MRSRVGFDWAVYGLVGLCLALTVIEVFDPSPWYHFVLAPIGLFGLVALYTFIVRPVLPAGSPRPWWVIALLAMSVGIACAGFASLMPVQIAAHVMAWATVRRTRIGILSSAIISASGCVGALFSVVPLEPYVLILISVFAFAAAIAYGMWIQHAQRDANEQAALVQELRATREALTTASRRAGQMEERARVSRDLHDTLTQSVAALALTATQARDSGDPATLKLVGDMAQEALREARGMLSELAPVDTVGNAALSVSGVAARFDRETDLTIEVSVEPVIVDTERELALIRCAQEGLANVRRHARATTAHVRLRVCDDAAGDDAAGDSLAGDAATPRPHRAAVLEIADDGVGLPAGRDPERGFGLRGMRDRVAAFGGRVALGLRPDPPGCLLHVTVPLADDSEPSAGSNARPARDTRQTAAVSDHLGTA